VHSCHAQNKTGIKREKKKKPSLDIITPMGNLLSPVFDGVTK
jgi:hypothetical protein